MEFVGCSSSELWITWASLYLFNSWLLLFLKVWALCLGMVSSGTFQESYLEWWNTLYCWMWMRKHGASNSAGSRPMTPRGAGLRMRSALWMTEQRGRRAAGPSSYSWALEPTTTKSALLLDWPIWASKPPYWNLFELIFLRENLYFIDSILCFAKHCHLRHRLAKPLS